MQNQFLSGYPRISRVNEDERSDLPRWQKTVVFVLDRDSARVLERLLGAHALNNVITPI